MAGRSITPLEALGNIKREAGFPYFSALYDIDMWIEDFHTVEAALKDYENLKLKHRAMQDKILDDFKKLKAFEVIKECFVLNGFDELIPNEKWFESEEKQDLLREVLL